MLWYPDSIVEDTEVGQRGGGLAGARRPAQIRSHCPCADAVTRAKPRPDDSFEASQRQVTSGPALT